MKVLYRISDGSYLKDKLAFTNKMFCLTNFCSVFENIEIIIIADNCREETIKELSKRKCEVIQTALGNSKSWQFCVEYAIEKFSEDETVYLVEDDYLHFPDSPILIEEGIDIADYVTLYDHPDKYVNKDSGGNSFVEGGGEKTRLLITKSVHWKITNSTTMTFAVKVKTLRKDKSLWWKFTKKGYPQDFEAFKQLSGRGSLYNILFGRNRKLISCIPGWSTHTDLAYLSPLRNWEHFS